MLKKFAKKVIAAAVAATMAVSLAVVAVPQTAEATQGWQNYLPRELETAGWTQGVQDPIAWSKTVNYTLRSISDAGRRVAVYSGIPAFDWTDNITWDGKGSYYDNIIDSVEVINGTVYVNTSSRLSYMTDRRERVLVMSSQGITVGAGNDRTQEPSHFTLEIDIDVYNEGNTPDPKSISEGWQTNDSGRTYTLTYDTYTVGEGMQGTSLPVAIPYLSSNGYFSLSDMTMDSNASRFIKSASMSGSNYLSLTFVDNLTPFAQVGTSGSLTFRKTITNDTGSQATYTLTIPLRVTNLANATVNGLKGPATIYMTQGDRSGLRVTGVDTSNNAVVHWTTDASGYVDASNMYSLPRISSNGTIDTSSMAVGTYYFYIRVGENLETRTYTLNIVGAVPTPTPTPTPTPSPSGAAITRLYNTRTGEHLYTTDSNEVAELTRSTWKNEGVIGYSGGSVGIYRLRNKRNSAHLYTGDTNEINTLIKGDWAYDNGGSPMFYGATTGNPMYRLYNARNARTSPTAQHHYTSDANEVRVLCQSQGWTQDNNGAPSFYLQK